MGTFPPKRIIYHSALWSCIELPHIKLRNSEQTEETCVSEPLKRLSINTLDSPTTLWWIEAAQYMCCLISYTHAFKSIISYSFCCVSFLDAHFLWQIWMIRPYILWLNKREKALIYICSTRSTACQINAAPGYQFKSAFYLTRNALFI